MSHLLLGDALPIKKSRPLSTCWWFSFCFFLPSVFSLSICTILFLFFDIQLVFFLVYSLSICRVVGFYFLVYLYMANFGLLINIIAYLIKKTTVLLDFMQSMNEPLDTALNKSSCTQADEAHMKPHGLLSDSSDWLVRNWKGAALKQMFQSLESDGGLKGCIQEVLASHSEASCAVEAKVFLLQVSG